MINSISLKAITCVFHTERRTSFSLFTLCQSELMCKFRQIYVLFYNREEKIGIQNMLTDLRSFQNVEAMDRTGILRRALDLKFERNRGSAERQHVRKELARAEEEKLMER